MQSSGLDGQSMLQGLQQRYVFSLSFAIIAICFGNSDLEMFW
jgi:hypothetical protein